MFEGPLSKRRDLISQIEAAPLFDYLVRHGVLNDEQVEALKSEECSTTVNTSLLEYVENYGKNGVGLFVNALRQAGQHQVASLLDDEEQRIKALSGSGYLSKSRHKGQISLTIKVHAIQLPEGSLPEWEGSKSIGQKLWLSMDDIQLHMCNTGPRFESDSRLSNGVHNMEIADQQEDEKRSGCCFCFKRLFSRNKKRKETKPKETQKPKPNETEFTSVCHNGSDLSATDRGQSMSTLPSTKSRDTALSRTCSERYPAIRNNSDIFGGGGDHGLIPAVHFQDPRWQQRASDYLPSAVRVDHYINIQEKIQNLKNAADTFKRKSQTFYEALQDTSDVPYTRMLKYFEQDRGILVLDTFFDDGLVIVSISMKQDQLDHLERDLDNGKFNKDIENCTITDDVLHRVGAVAMKLQICMDREEFMQAKDELC